MMWRHKARDSFRLVSGLYQVETGMVEREARMNVQ